MVCARLTMQQKLTKQKQFLFTFCYMQICDAQVTKTLQLRARSEANLRSSHSNWAGNAAKPEQKYFCLGFATCGVWAALNWADHVAKPKHMFLCASFATCRSATHR